MGIIAISHSQGICTIGVAQAKALASLPGNIHRAEEKIHVISHLIFQAAVSQLHVHRVCRILNIHHVQEIRELRGCLEEQLESLRVILYPVAQSGKGKGKKHRVSYDGCIYLSSLIGKLLAGRYDSQFGLCTPVAMLCILIPCDRRNQAMRILRILTYITVASILRAFILRHRWQPSYGRRTLLFCPIQLVQQIKRRMPFLVTMTKTVIHGQFYRLTQAEVVGCPQLIEKVPVWMVSEVLIAGILHLLIITIVYGILIEQVLLALIVGDLSYQVDVITRALELDSAYRIETSCHLIAFAQSLLLISVDQGLADKILRTDGINIIEHFPADIILHRGECARNIIAVPVELIILEYRLQEQVYLVVKYKV